MKATVIIIIYQKLQMFGLIWKVVKDSKFKEISHYTSYVPISSTAWAVLERIFVT